MAERNFWPLNGLVKNSTAPAFIAWTDIGMSPWPVTKTIGIAMPALANSCCKSRPLKPGIRTSSTKHDGPSGRFAAKNSRAEPNAWTLKPARRIRRSVDRRNDGSSSTTNTMESACSTRHLAPETFVALFCWERAVKGRTRTRTRRRPQAAAVRFDDGAADAQTHAQAVRLCGVEGVEEAFAILGVKTGAEIPHDYQHRRRAV